MREQPEIQHVSTRAGYDLWAPSYDADANPLPALEGPLTEELLGDVSGLLVLDLGCGTGRHAVRLAAAGATVHAIDFSTGMLDRAKEKTGAARIVFQSHDVTKPLPFAANSFDRVLCALVLDHISDLPFLFSEMHRVCRITGSVVVSVIHPAMKLLRVQARFRDPTSGEEIRPASCEHELSDYVMAAARAGFAIDQMSEHAVDETLAAHVERARKYLGWPMLLLMRLLPKRTQQEQVAHVSHTP